MIKLIKNYSKLDNWGICVSLVCFVHCAAMPILLISSTYLSAELEGIHELEPPLLLLAIIIGTLAIYGSYKTHRKILPIILMLCGFILLLAGDFFSGELEETFIRITGASAVMTGHVFNKRFQNRAANNEQ